VQAGNANFLPAFGNSIGGDDLGGGVSLTGYFFVRNDLGWRITHEPYDQEIRFAGDIYPTDPNLPLFDATPDPYSVQFILQRSSATQVVATGTSGGDSKEDIYNHFTTEGREEPFKADLTNVEADLEVINQGVKDASLLIPHTQDL
jgi:hypothetical protein